MKSYSVAERVDKGVTEGVSAAIAFWEEEIQKGRDNLSMLAGLIGEAVKAVKEEYPEARWQFGLGHGGAWEFTVFSAKTSKIHELISPMLTQATDQGFYIYPVSRSLEELDDT